MDPLDYRADAFFYGDAKSSRHFCIGGMIQKEKLKLFSTDIRVEPSFVGRIRKAKRQEKGLFVPIALAAAGVLILVVGMTMMQRSAANRPYRDVPDGDVERGRKALMQYNCGSCHKIPGVDGANGTRGQPLAGLALRYDIVGALPNTPEDLTRWIQDPKSIYPATVMPTLNVSKQEALDTGASPYTLPP